MVSLNFSLVSKDHKTTKTGLFRYKLSKMLNVKLHENENCYRKCLVPQASAHSSPQEVHEMAESADANIMQPKVKKNVTKSAFNYLRSRSRPRPQTRRI